MNKKSLITTRIAQQEDYNFIVATWLRGLYYGNDWFREINKDVFMTRYRPVIDAILKRSGVETIMSCLKEDPDVVLGYAVIEGPILHWVFVKYAWRNIGISKDLVSKDILVTTHMTRKGKSLKPKTMEFNPFLI